MTQLKDKKYKYSIVLQHPNSDLCHKVDIYIIKFKDKACEKARQKHLAAELAGGEKNAKQIKADQHAIERIRKQK
eukprot:15357728-Ditylum_brightwellii.AAC.1